MKRRQAPNQMGEEPQTTARARQLRRMTAQMLDGMSPQERERMLQRHLALARGARGNALLMRQMTAAVSRLRRRINEGESLMTNDPVFDIISLVTDVLDRVGVAYALTGSVASAIHGEPWTSQDVDFIVRMSPEQAVAVAEGLPRRFYCDAASVRAAAREFGIANLIDQDTGLKVDLSVLAPKPFYERVFARRQPTDLGGGGRFFIVSPEDIILMKLEWRRHSRSQKQWENALSVVRAKGARLDWEYLLDQADQLGLTEDLKALRDEGGV